MHITTPSLLRHVYAQTAKGREEIVRPKFGLNPRQRRILNFVDGVKTLSLLREQFPIQEMEDIVSILSEQQFIHLIGENVEEHRSMRDREHGRHVYHWSSSYQTGLSSRRTAPMPRLTRDAERIRRAKEFMLEIAAIHLGILGRDIVQKIDSARCAHSLAGITGQWAMALCASKGAARYAQLYLEQLKLILFEEEPELLSLHPL
ncbi:MAG: hypothetical protein ACO1NO_04025 [Burkholderiaceae bacterium]